MKAHRTSQRAAGICGKLTLFFHGVPRLHTPTSPKFRRCPGFLCCLLILGTGVFSGCDPDLKAIDAQTDSLVRDRIAKLGGGAVAPGVRTDSPQQVVSSRTLVEKEPPSTNPAATDLRFNPAAESRDVAARLAGLQADTLENARSLDLNASFLEAQQGAREYLTAEEDYILAAIRLLIERHRFSPRLFANSALDYQQIQTSGSRDMTLRLVNQLGARQQLPFGGEVAARWIWDASENLRSASSGRYIQSSRLVLDGNIPLLRGAGDIAQETLIQSERDLVYGARRFESFRREFLVAIARDYFQLLQQLDSINSTERQVEALQVLERRQRAWLAAGRVREFEVNLATNSVLQAQAGLANQREGYILLLDRFKVRLGLPVRTPVTVVPTELTLAEPEISLDDATHNALEFRLDLQNERDKLDDSRRQVVNAKNQLLPDLNIRGNVTFPTKIGAREGGSVYEFDDVQFGAGATLDLPLDRRIEQLQLRQSMIALQQQQRAFDKFRDDLILDVRARTREIERARLNLTLAEERVKINQRRKEEQDLKPDEVTTQEQVDTANDLREAERARDQAKADLRNAVLDFLLATGQLRVKRDGALETLPGMVVESLDPAGSSAAPVNAQPSTPSVPTPTGTPESVPAASPQ